MNCDLTAARVGIEEYPQIWDVCAEFLQMAIEYSTLQEDIETVKEKIRLGDQQLWTVYSYDGRINIYACATTEIIESPEKRLDIKLVAGNSMFMWDELLMDAIRMYALENGCPLIQASGRKGWRKYGERHGFKEAYTVFRADLSHMRH